MHLTSHPQGRSIIESEIIAQARRGLPEGLAALYETHGGGLLRLATRLSGSDTDAEDFLHDLFVGLPELLGRYEHRDRLDAWLRGVMTRMVIGRMRSRRNKDVSLNAGQDRSLPGTPADPWNAIDLERAISRLTDTERSAFVLKLEGYSHDEIAALLGISTGASRVRHLRALRHLRKFLEPDK
jgi:RNA polymerase sigma-70 factor (ECF subfamily)